MEEKHSEKVFNVIDRLERRKDKLLVLFEKMLSAYGGNCYPVDLFAIGAIKRIISAIVKAVIDNAQSGEEIMSDMPLIITWATGFTIAFNGLTNVIPPTC